MSLPASIPSSPRSTRPLAARKQPNDPAWFSTNNTSVTSVKRQAMERIEGEPRNKRKRVVEPTLQTSSQLGHRVEKPQERQNDELPVVCRLFPCCCPPRWCFPLGCTIAAESPICQQGDKIRVGYPMGSNHRSATDGFLNATGRRRAPVFGPIRPHSCRSSIAAECA
jgi:hypothetical protein